MMEFESNPSKPVVKRGLCMSSPKPLLLLLVGTFDAAQGREHIHYAQCNNNIQNFGFWHRQEEAQCNKLKKKAAATLQWSEENYHLEIINNGVAALPKAQCVARTQNSWIVQNQLWFCDRMKSSSSAATTTCRQSSWICITNLDHKSLSVLWHHLNFQWTTRSGSLKYFRIREPSSQVLWKNQKQRIAGLGEKTSKDLEAFIKELSKNRKFVFFLFLFGGELVIGFCQIFFWELWFMYLPGLGLWFFWQPWLWILISTLITV